MKGEMSELYVEIETVELRVHLKVYQEEKGSRAKTGSREFRRRA